MGGDVQVIVTAARGCPQQHIKGLLCNPRCSRKVVKQIPRKVVKTTLLTLILYSHHSKLPSPHLRVSLNFFPPSSFFFLCWTSHPTHVLSSPKGLPSKQGRLSSLPFKCTCWVSWGFLGSKLINKFQLRWECQTALIYCTYCPPSNLQICGVLNGGRCMPTISGGSFHVPPDLAH